MKNNFDELRLLGAFLVALGHTLVIFTGQDFADLVNHNQSMGGLGLNMFCIISGYLITKSRLTRNTSDFVQARALRLMPALLLAMPIMAFIVGPLVTNLPMAQYLSSTQTFAFLLTVFILPYNPALPGVFGGVGIVAQLYSLTAEVLFYSFSAIFGVKKYFRTLVLVLLGVVWVIFVRNDYSTLSFAPIFQLKLSKLILFSFPLRLGLLCIFYLLAGCAWALFDFEKMRAGRLLPFCIVIWVAALGSHDRLMYDMVEMMMLPIIVLGIGISSSYNIPLRKYIGDISYGIYIYHFAIAEFVHTQIKGISILQGVLISLIMTFIAGWLSFHLIEARALKLVRRKDQKIHLSNQIQARPAYVGS